MSAREARLGMVLRRRYYPTRLRCPNAPPNEVTNIYPAAVPQGDITLAEITVAPHCQPLSDRSPDGRGTERGSWKRPPRERGARREASLRQAPPLALSVIEREHRAELGHPLVAL